MSNRPLNPDALENAADIIWMNTRGESGICDADRRTDDFAVLEAITSVAIKEYLATAQPDTQKLTDAEWQAFQAIPDQGYSHRAWVDERIAERVAQPVVNGVEELDALPLLTIVRDAHGHRAEKWAHGFKLIGAVGTYSIDLPARVLYLPEVTL